MTSTSELILKKKAANLSQAKKLYRSWLRNKDAQTSTTTLKAFLLELTNSYTEDKQVGLHRQLLDYWLHTMEYWANQPSTTPYYTKDAYYIDGFIQELLLSEALSDYLKDREDAQLLAYLCTARIYLSTTSRAHPKENNVATVLQEWTKESVPRGVLHSLEEAVAYLYGKAAFALYRDDVTTDLELLRYLYLQKIPLADLRTETPVALTNTYLPEDFGSP